MKGLLSLLLSSLIATGVILGSISTNIDAEDLDASQGVQNIKQLESSDVSAVQKIITDYEKELEEKNKPKEEENKGNNNKLDFKSIFKRDMFIGDSQSEGLNLYGFLYSTIHHFFSKNAVDVECPIMTIFLFKLLFIIS